MTTYLLFVVGCVAQKVYFDCGARVDVVDAQGLILSPGFPYNYSSGTHCVWQFFVPIDFQLILEIFDFDVFESHDAASQYSNIGNFEDSDEEVTFIQGRSVSDDASKEDSAKDQQSFPDAQVKQVVLRDQSTKMELTKVSNSAKRSADISPNSAQPSLVVIPGSLSPNDKSSSLPSAETTTVLSTLFTESSPVSPETQQPILDACPHDVLYISDLITFASRFCGSNKPPSSQLVFGSDQEMVEVIMELITTTHWGRGFALLFHYHNLTEPGATRRNVTFASSTVDSLLATVSGAAFLALILTSALCIIFRPKFCPKRDNSSTSSSPEVPEGVPHIAPELSELQLMAEDQTGAENKDHSPPLTVSAGAGDTSAEVDLSGGLMELDLGPDEVFISSPAPGVIANHFTPHTRRERFLRHSDTGPGPSGDWPSPDSCGSRSKSVSSSRPRAWSVRTFQDFFPPLPQLHKKWCSWNSTSPFTKLVDTAPSSRGADARGNVGREVFSDENLGKTDTSTISDSPMSNASYPLTQQAQRQRRLNSTSNLRRSRFTGPCFGLLSGTTDPAKTLPAQSPTTEPAPVSSSADSSQPGKRRGEIQAEGDHISVQVFAISEEEDRQPLVPAEHLDHPAAPQALNGLGRGVYEGKRSVGGSPKSQRARGEWRPWGSQVSGGVMVSSKAAHTVRDPQVPVGPATALCSAIHQM
uniref:CUB domain-containing protein n=1 Tax=Knipowitschia caucasica TaxID=637954 RepID=A0AAV2MTC7_KNICA